MSKPKVKICGLTNLSDARFAAQHGADMLGFIFYEPSPRHVAPATARRIVAALKGEFTPRPKFVGVFVNAPRHTVEETMALCDLDLVQLHGNESPELVNYFQGRAFKACKPRSLEEAKESAKQYLSRNSSLILLDAYHPQLWGGSGHPADWAMAAQIAKNHTLLLAGGLSPDNLAQAIQTVNPWGVDVSSGVEVTKGKKDHSKVKRFIEIAQAGI